MIRKFPFTMVSPGGVYCQGKGCSHCGLKGCPYSEFVRRYWNHPVFD